MQAISSTRSTSMDTVLEQLRELIMIGELKPRTRLTHRDLAERFGVSPMPVRDAVRQLMNDGLVVAEGQKTIVVAPLNVDEFLDVMEMRLTLEPRALELAQPAIADRDVKQLRHMLKQSDVTGEPRKSVEQHWQFHKRLYEPCKRPRMLAAIDAQHVHLNRYLLPSWGNAGVGTHWTSSEFQLVKLIEQKKASEAVKFLKDDIEKAMLRVLRTIRT